MIDVHERDLEYQALRHFVKTLDSSQNRLIKNLSTAINEELTPKQQVAVRLYFIEQNTQREIAEKTGVTASTVSRTLTRAKRRLRRCLRYGGQALLDAVEDDD